VGSLDVKPEQQSTQRLLGVQYGAAYAPTADSTMGRLLFLREGTLMTQPFDNRRLELAGEPAPVAERVGTTNNVQGRFGVSASGVLAYRTGAAGGGNSLNWFDRQGKSLGAAAETATYGSVALSPDGTRAAVGRSDSSGLDIWIVEFARGASTRFTFDPARDYAPVWSPDGTRIVFRSERGGAGDLYQKTASGAGGDEVLLKSPESKTPDDWSRAGRFLLYSVFDRKTMSDLWVLPLQGDRKPVPYLNTEFSEAQGQFSPDGHFVAYRSDESGQSEIYVRPFPATSGDVRRRRQVDGFARRRSAATLAARWQGTVLYCERPEGDGRRRQREPGLQSGDSPGPVSGSRSSGGYLSLGCQRGWEEIPAQHARCGDRRGSAADHRGAELAGRAEVTP
jgi:hypothetical protein